MRKYIACIYLIIVLMLTRASDCRGYENSDSATFRSQATSNKYDYRVVELRKFLESYDSPLSIYAKDFVVLADKYDLDYRMVPAITGVESTFGKRIPKNSFNAYGWANGKYTFKSWQDSIEVVTFTLKTQYIDKGAHTIDQIGRIYAPPSKTWSVKVKFFMNEINPMPVTFDI